MQLIWTIKKILPYSDFHKPFDLPISGRFRTCSVLGGKFFNTKKKKNISLPTSSQESEELFVRESTALSRK